MKTRILTLILSVFAISFLVADPMLAATVTVAKWNLEWFPGRTPNPTAEAQKKHMEAAQRVLKQLNPDIFLAEEIGDWDSFQKLVSVVPKLRVHTVSAFRQGQSVGRQQEAIVSDLPANSTWSEPWQTSQAKPTASLWKSSEDASDHEPVVLKIEIPDRSAP